MTTVTISMPDSLKSFLETEVAAKGYGNTSEYIRELLRGAQKRAEDERLDHLLMEGLASGPGREWNAATKSDLRASVRKLKLGKRSSADEAGQA